MGDAFELDLVLAHGSLPGIVSEPDPGRRAADLRAYTDLYLREEVQAEALVRDLGGYARLLDLVAAASGTILNIHRLCKEAGVRYETARRYIEILEDTLIVFRVPAYRASARGQILAHPRLYLFDLGVRNALLRRPLDRPLDDERGLLLEHLVAYELHRRTGTLWPDMELAYFRSRHGAEVDFIVRAGSELWAIEVKSSRNVTPPMTATVRTIGEHIPDVTRRLLIFLGPRPQRIENVEVLPLQDFLAQLPS